MKNILLHHHLGLGDHIDCNGMVRYFSELYPDNVINIPAKSHYYSMIEFMFRDNEKIKVHKISGNEYEEVSRLYTELNPESIFVVGHQYYPNITSPDKNCWEYFYEQFEIDLDIKYDMFYMDRDLDGEEKLLAKLNPKMEEYIFVHDDKDRGFEIEIDSDYKIIRNDIKENIFHFPSVLKNAKEIHLMESSFKSMVEHFETDGELFFHDFRGHPLGKHIKNWKVIDYES